jgi:hypothetical protein
MPLATNLRLIAGVSGFAQGYMRIDPKGMRFFLPLRLRLKHHQVPRLSDTSGYTPLPSLSFRVLSIGLMCLGLATVRGIFSILFRR